MNKKDKIFKIFLIFIFIVLSPILLNIFMQEIIAKYIIGLLTMVIIGVTIIKGLEINGIPDILAVIWVESAPVLINFFSDIPFIHKMTKIYISIAQFFCSMIGKDIIVNIDRKSVV